MSYAAPASARAQRLAPHERSGDPVCRETNSQSEAPVVAIAAAPELACSVSVCSDAATHEATTPTTGELFCDCCAAKAQALAVMIDLPIDIRRLDTGAPIADTATKLEHLER